MCLLPRVCACRFVRVRVCVWTKDEPLTHAVNALLSILYTYYRFSHYLKVNTSGIYIITCVSVFSRLSLIRLAKLRSPDNYTGHFVWHGLLACALWSGICVKNKNWSAWQNRLNRSAKRESKLWSHQIDLHAKRIDLQMQIKNYTANRSANANQKLVQNRSAKCKSKLQTQHTDVYA